ncbi:MAG: magnesium-translocating P-type ATPase [Acidobacteriota bacterium]|nr:magnesium-translocating P-type ATPase [Acidobacteriota bacterium]
MSETGLSSAEAARRLEEFGLNEPAPKPSHPWLVQFPLLFLNPLVLILLLAAAASALLGQLVDASIVAAIVGLGAIVNFVQSYRSQRAVERLRDQVAPAATVLRDGAWKDTPRAEVVPGDLVRLSAGDLVPADARLVESRDLYVQQGALTGESAAVEKEAAPEPGGRESGPEARNLVFLGTSVIGGAATALVLTTGPRTMFGDIAQRVAARPAETEFERGLRQFSILIARAVLFLVLFIVMVRVAMHRQPMESLLFAVALGVGLTPEFLPMIVSVTLAHGAVRMARAKVIVKHLPAIQNLGSIDVLCSDKTGTLTTGHMTVERAVDVFGDPCDEVLRLAYLNSEFETGLRSPLDAAILRAEAGGVDGYEKLDEIPFDFERRRSSVVVRTKTGTSTCRLITKGAPEGILPVSGTYLSTRGPIAFDPEVRAKAETLLTGLSAKGLRLLAVAYRDAAVCGKYPAGMEQDLTLAGFVSFVDPPVEDAAEVIAALRRDGIAIRILTGDNELVAKHICDLTGIDGGRAVLGDEVDRMSEAALQHVVENTSLFARVSPRQKTRILMALRHRGHVVGFMGDGINDAPSLHAADVGISVASAADVARDAAGIILTEPGLAILHNGIMEGRRAFGNVTKYLLMGTSSNFGNMFSMAAASLFLGFLPMLPSQILLNNFLYDLAQVTIPLDRVDAEYLSRPQRWDIRLIRNFMVLIGPVSSVFDFLTFYVLLHYLKANAPLFHTGWFVESLATQTLVLLVIRTGKRPWRSRPGTALMITTLAIALSALVLPFLPMARDMGFVPLPADYYVFLMGATVFYLGLVEIVKQRLFGRVAVISTP